MRSTLTWAVRLGFIAAVTGLAWFSLTAAVVAICATILVAIQARASTLIEVSFGPLRAKLEREITEAERLVEKLRDFAALQAKGIISASTRLGRWTDESDDWTFQSLRETEAALRELGVSEERIREARFDFVRFAASDLGSSAMGTGIVPVKLGQDAVREWQTVMGKGLRKTPDEIEAYLTKWGSLTPERQQRIDEMRWVLTNQDIRDRDQFLLAHRPVEWPA